MQEGRAVGTSALDAQGDVEHGHGPSCDQLFYSQVGVRGRRAVGASAVVVQVAARRGRDA